MEGKQIVSTLSTLPSHSSKPALLNNDFSFLPFPGCWQAICNQDLHDPGHHTNEGSC
jgi:hypothetical protein